MTAKRIIQSLFENSASNLIWGKDARTICVTTAFLCVILSNLPSQARAQNEASSRPLSAIDWLSDSISLPPPSSQKAILPPANGEPATSTGASVDDIMVSSIQAPVLDALGLFPHQSVGLPHDLWGPSRSEDLAQRISRIDLELLPALQSLMTRLMLVEVDPPQSLDGSVDRLFLARVDRLLAIGALEHAQGMLSQAGGSTPRVFQRAFDTALLLGDENAQCDILRENPDLSPKFTTRVFCLARQGDWDAAVLTMGTGRALGFITAKEDALLSRFLDPELFEDEPLLEQPSNPTPLVFRLFEAIGNHIDTQPLALAFAQADLRANIGWKARASAAERLARVGSVTDNQILGLYAEKKPSASGGIWDRMRAVSRLEDALRKGDSNLISNEISNLWIHLTKYDLEVVFSRIFGQKLQNYSLQKGAADIAFRMGLLSDHYEETAQKNRLNQENPQTKILSAIARADTSDISPTDLAAAGSEYQAVVEGFNQEPLRVELREELRRLLDQNKLGEAILSAISLFTSGSKGDLDELRDAIKFFRYINLENVARQAALQYLILETHP